MTACKACGNKSEQKHLHHGVCEHCEKLIQQKWQMFVASLSRQEKEYFIDVVKNYGKEKH